MKDKPLKVYRIQHKGCQIILETDRTKRQSIELLLMTLLREARTDPAMLKTFVDGINSAYAILQKKKNSNAIEADNFGFWEELMRQPVS